MDGSADKIKGAPPFDSDLSPYNRIVQTIIGNNSCRHIDNLNNRRRGVTVVVVGVLSFYSFFAAACKTTWPDQRRERSL